MDSNEQKRLMQRAAISDLKNKVKEWTKDRDQSHGYRHMEEVAKIALQLYDQEKENQDQQRTLPDRFLVEVSAWTHDVADHKYDKHRVLLRKMMTYLKSDPLTGPLVADIMWIINNVSYSHEVKHNGKNLEKHVNDSIGYARDLVSDADKSLALGETGFERCFQYTMNKLGFDEDTDFDRSDENKIADLIGIHAQEKLLRLYPDGFFRTDSGKKIAEKLHLELEEILKEKNILKEEISME